MLECIGKYIGLDRLLCETGIYGECTLLNSILGRKNKKMGMEAHTTMYLALYHLYLKEASQKRPDMVGMLEKISTANVLLEGDYKEDKCKNHRKEVSKVMNEGLSELLQTFHQSLNHQDGFLRNYMDMFESLLLFVR